MKLEIKINASEEVKLYLEGEDFDNIGVVVNGVEQFKTTLDELEKVIRVMRATKVKEEERVDDDYWLSYIRRMDQQYHLHEQAGYERCKADAAQLCHDEAMKSLHASNWLQYESQPYWEEMTRSQCLLEAEERIRVLRFNPYLQPSWSDYPYPSYY